MSMRLFDTESKRFQRFQQWNTPPYAAVAYAWNGRQSPYSSVKGTSSPQWSLDRLEYELFTTACVPARQQGLQYIWAGSLSFAEDCSRDQAQALENVRNFYRRAQLCLVFLSGDFPQQCNEDEWERQVEIADTQGFLDILVSCRLELRDMLSHTETDVSLPSLGPLMTGRGCLHMADCLDTKVVLNGTKCMSAIDSTESRAAPGLGISYLLLIVFTNTSGILSLQSNSAKLRWQHPNTVISAATHSHSNDECGNQHFTHQAWTESLSTSLKLHPYFFSFFNQEGAFDLENTTRGYLPDDGLPCWYAEPPCNRYEALWGDRLLPEAGLFSDRIRNARSISKVSLQKLASACQETARLEMSTRLDRQSVPMTPSPPWLEDSPLGHNNSQPIPAPSIWSLPQDTFSAIRSWLDSTVPNQVTELHQKEASFGEVDLDESMSSTSSQTDIDTNELAENQWLLFDELTSEYSSTGRGDSDATLTRRLVEHAVDQYSQEASSPRPITPENNESILARIHSPDSQDLSCNGRELACPFYKRDPVKYLSCLKSCRLINITQLKEHLLQQHRLPPYCPICKKGFQTAKSRDRHIVRRTCSFHDVFPFEGISDDQRRLLLRRHKGCGLQQQWKRICEVIKLETIATESPYIKDSLGKQVVAFRDYWRRHGQRIIATSLKTFGFDSSLWQNEERRLACLYSKVLFGTLDIITRKRHRMI